MIIIIIMIMMITNSDCINELKFKCYYCEKTKFCGKRPIIKPKTSECDGDWYSYKQCTRKSFLLFRFNSQYTSLQICTLFHEEIDTFGHERTFVVETTTTG